MQKIEFMTDFTTHKTCPEGKLFPILEIKTLTSCLLIDHEFSVEKIQTKI